jgi:hypothetical protein
MYGNSIECKGEPDGGYCGEVTRASGSHWLLPVAAPGIGFDGGWFRLALFG